MIKLNNAQITALAEEAAVKINKALKEQETIRVEKWYSDLSEKFPEFNDKLQQCIELCKDLNSQIDSMKGLNKYTYCPKFSGYEIDDFKSQLFHSLTQSNKQVSHWDVKRDIVIATIESDNIEELINKVTDKYLNQ